MGFECNFLSVLGSFLLMYLSAARHVALCSSDLQRDMLPLTCLYVCDHSRVVKWAGEEVSPTGAPTGITHGSRMAGVNPQASPTLRSIPHLPDTGTSHQAKVTNSPRLQQQRNFYSLCTILEESFHSSTAWNTLQLTRTDYYVQTVKSRSQGYISNVFAGFGSSHHWYTKEKIKGKKKLLC